MFHVKQFLRIIIKYLFLCTFSVFYSCGEESVHLDVSGFNKRIEYRTDFKTAKDVMYEFYNLYNNDENNNLQLSEENLTPGRFKVTLINSRLNDDSMAAEKLEMIVKHDGTKWKVITVEKNWKCHNDRGHGDWGIQPCN